MSECLAGADLIVGFLDFFLGCCARYPEDLVEVLLIADKGTCVKGQCADSMGGFETWEVTNKVKG